MKAVHCLSLPLLALMMSSAASASDVGPLALTIDTAKIAGPLKPFDGVNGQPISDRWGGTDATRGYREARIGFIRLHDAGAGDIDSVHTNRMQVVPGGAPRVMRPRVELNPLSMFLNPDADVDNPASYNFGPTDTLIAQIHAAGAEPFFRIGRSWGADSDPPQDFDKFARIAANVVRHYNFGWANGFHYGIRYWEVWNEPDMSLFWQGQPEQYFELYAKVAKAVKGADPAALVGGPVQSLPNDDHPYGNDFLAYVRDKKLPLDFYSWHWYAFANDPYDFARLGRKLRDRLDHYGFQHTASIIDEWNSTLAQDGNLGLNNSVHAAFVGSALAYMQDAPIDQQMIYRADGYFTGKQPTKEGQVLIAWGRMKDTPARLAVSGTRTDGFAATAGKSADGKLIRVFLSNYEVPAPFRKVDPAGVIKRHIGFQGNFEMLRRQEFGNDSVHGYALSLKGLAPGSYEVKRFRIAADRNFDLVDTSKISNDRASIKSDLAPGEVELLEIRPLP